jgi:hypothetical protein
MKPIKRTTVGEVLSEYQGQGLRFEAAGVGDVSLDAFLVTARTLGSLEMPVDLYDAEFGLQLFDPKRSTPVGWIRPNPLRQA